MRCPTRPALLAAAFASLALVHCGKKSASAERAPTPVSRASAAPSTSIAGAVAAPASPAASAGAPVSAELRTVSGTMLRAAIRASGSKGAIVNAFASWCGPCRDEVPMLQALARNLKTQGIDVILVSMDEPEDAAKARAFLQSADVRLPAFLAERPLGAFKVGLYPRWPGMIPATFLVDAQGKTRYFWGGPVEEGDIVPIVDGFLDGKAIDGEADFTLAPGRVER